MLVFKSRPLIDGNPDGQHMLDVTEVMRREYIKNYPQGELDMSETQVNYLHTCGTVHCAGGWDAVLLCDVENERIHYSHGVDAYAHILGFKEGEAIKVWADRNEFLWGNERGYAMYASSKSYISELRHEARSYVDVLDHRIEVAKRLIILQKE